jgi:asparagine N-glycosylation enzyme membrane subunit Stt3
MASYLNRKFSLESWAVDLHPISLISRSITVFIKFKARSTPACPCNRERIEVETAQSYRLSPWEATVLPLNYARVNMMLVGANASV